MTNDVEALAPGRAAATRRSSTTRASSAPTCASSAARTGSGLDCDPVGSAVLLHTVQTYSLGRDVSFQDLTAERSLLSLVGPGGRGRARRGAPGRGARVRGGRARRVRAHRARRGRDHLRPRRRPRGPRRAGGLRATRSSAAASRAAGRGSASTWTATRFPRRPGSTSAPSASPRAATSARRRSRACTTRASRTATCAACGSPRRPPAATRSCSGSKVVGRIGSTCESPRLGPIALALVRREAAPGDEVLVAGAAGHGGRAAVHG